MSRPFAIHGRSALAAWHAIVAGLTLSHPSSCSEQLPQAGPPPLAAPSPSRRHTAAS
jgi:hypothetical protein